MLRLFRDARGAAQGERDTCFERVHAERRTEISVANIGTASTGLSGW